LYVCRLELQSSKQSNYENTNLSLSVKLNQMNESKEPAYDVIDPTRGSQDVKMTPNPAYGTASIKMDKNAAYK